MMARKQFLDGTIRIGDLSEVTGLRLTKVATGAGKGFRVIALPGEEIVYWSFFQNNHFLTNSTAPSFEITTCSQ